MKVLIFSIQALSLSAELECRIFQVNAMWKEIEQDLQKPVRMIHVPAGLGKNSKNVALIGIISA
jgi:hypothetical protein